MDQHLIFLLLGLANGAVFASLAMALVVTYRSSGVLNFATGTIALYGAYTYAFLRQGQLLVLIPGLPEKVDLGSDLSFWPATLLTLLITALLGLLLYLVVFRPLRAAPAVAKAVASIGVMVVMTGLMSQRLGTAPVSVDAILPTNVWTLGSVRISSDRVWFAVAIVGHRARDHGRLPLHPFRTAHPRRGRDGEGRTRQRHRADRVAAAELDDQRGGGRDRRDPHRADRAAGRPSPTRCSSSRRWRRRCSAVSNTSSRRCSGGSFIGMLQSEVTYFRSQHTWLPARASPS